MGHKKVKTIEALLKKPNLTVEDVLDFDSVLQKAKNREEPLMDYLSRSDHIHELLNRIVKPNGNAEKNLKYYWAKMLSFIKVLFRYPFIASELLNCISEDFFDYLEADLEGLDVFWKFLGNPGELDPNLTIYLAKTLMLVLLKRPKTVNDSYKMRAYPQTKRSFI